MPSFRAYQPRPTPLSDLAAQEGLQTREGDERSGMQAGPPPTYSRVDPQGRIQKPYQKVPLACEFCKSAHTFFCLEEAKRTIILTWVCVERKIRCDGDRPCWNCLSRGVHCEYAIRRRTRGPGKAPKGSRKKNSGKARAASTTSSSSQYPPSTYASSSHLSESISPTSETQPQDLVFGHQRDPTLPFAGLAERYPASLEQPQAGPSRRSRGRTAGGRLSISEDEAPRAPKKVKREDHVEYSRPHGRQDDDEEDEDDYDDYDEDEEEG
ncbi:hypothetical protein PLICRDRAFT_39184 [Plicaturopsis crispa FD-325 SS-3]|nr:hypothetical protein PLICRDRAFT_39184 [Plicaturopsis crispa FD-325 SS-3]